MSLEPARDGTRLFGLNGGPREGSPRAAILGRFATAYLWSVSQTFAGGSVEIQRGIIATRGLGLPRG